MQDTRRQFLQAGGGLLVMLLAQGIALPGEAGAAEWNKAAFEAKKMDDLLKALGGAAPKASADILINASDIAENGAVVPIQIISKLDKTQSIAYVIEKNPNMLAAQFNIPEGTLPEIDTRVKMAQTSLVHALVKAQGKFYYASKEIKITLGGCGG